MTAFKLGSIKQTLHFICAVWCHQCMTRHHVEKFYYAVLQSLISRFKKKL